MGKEKGSIFYYLLFFVFLFSCKKEDKRASSPIHPNTLSCPDSKIQRTHIVHLTGTFTVDAQTIVPKGETPFPIVLNAGDVKKLNLGGPEILCRVLERRGIGAGNRSNLEKANTGLPTLTIMRGPGLKLKTEKTEFHMPPAEKAPELLSNFEHSLDRLLGR